MSRIALLAGATGLIGGFLLKRLLAEPEYARVKVLARRPPAHEEGKLELILTDFFDLEERGEQLACDDAFCCLGTTLRSAGSRAAFERVDYHMVCDLARAARAAGARRFIVVSAVGASPRSPYFYNRVKGRMEHAVADAGFEAVHILQPSLLLGPRAQARPFERIAQRIAPLLTPLLRGPLAKYQPVPADAVAGAMVHLALHGGDGVHVHHLPLSK